MKVYIDQVEHWPAYDFTLAGDDAFSTAHEIPDELWERFCEAGRTYWALHQEVLDCAGIKDPA